LILLSHSSVPIIIHDDINEELLKGQLNKSMHDLKGSRTILNQTMNLQVATQKYCIIDQVRLPVDKLKHASGRFKVRMINREHVNLLIESMEFKPCVHYTDWAVMVVTNRPAEEVKAAPENFEYMVLGGNHSLSATQYLLKENPSHPIYSKRNCKVYYNPPYDVAMEVSPFLLSSFSSFNH
jgi:hypothetical protein